MPSQFLLGFHHNLFYLRTKKIPSFILAALTHGNFCTTYRKPSPLRLTALTKFSPAQDICGMEEEELSVDLQVGHLQ
jgi:hypothetical protein